MIEEISGLDISDVAIDALTAPVANMKEILERIKTLIDAGCDTI